MNKKTAMLCVLGSLFMSDATGMIADPQQLHTLSPMATIDHSTIINKKQMIATPQTRDLFPTVILSLSAEIEGEDSVAGKAIINTLIQNLQADERAKAGIVGLSFSSFYRTFRTSVERTAMSQDTKVYDFLLNLDTKIKYTKFQRVYNGHEAVKLLPVDEADEKIFKSRRMAYRGLKLLNFIKSLAGH